MRVLLVTCCATAVMLAACGGDSPKPGSQGSRQATVAGSTSTAFKVELPGSWTKPPAAAVRQFKANYRKLSGLTAQLRAVREPAGREPIIALFATVESSSSKMSLEDVYTNVTKGLKGPITGPERIKLDGTPAIAFNTAEASDGERSEKRVVLCQRGEQLVSLNFSTLTPGKLAVARAEIDQIFESLRWRS